MRLCTFEVRTHLGRHQRLGAWTAEGIVDLNFAYAARHSQRLADAVLPASMREFLEGEESAMAAARETLSGLLPPAGHNDETLLYQPGEVRLRSPLPNPTSVRDFFAFEAHVKKGFEKRGEPMPPEWYEIPRNRTFTWSAA